MTCQSSKVVILNGLNLGTCLHHHCHIQSRETPIPTNQGKGRGVYGLGKALKNRKEMPTWKDIINFLKGKIEMLQTVFDMKKPNWKENLGFKSNAFHFQVDVKRGKFNCRKCNENQPLKQCKIL